MLSTEGLCLVDKLSKTFQIRKEIIKFKLLVLVTILNIHLDYLNS